MKKAHSKYCEVWQSKESYGYMIDFNSMMNAAQAPVPVDPVDIYNTLDLTAAAGPLRPVQQEVLKEWFADLQIAESMCRL